MNQHMTLAQEGPINTLALNKDCNKVVVTGRNSYAVLCGTILAQSDKFLLLLQFSVFVKSKILVLWKGTKFYNHMP